MGCVSNFNFVEGNSESNSIEHNFSDSTSNDGKSNSIHILLGQGSRIGIKLENSILEQNLPHPALL